MRLDNELSYDNCPREEKFILNLRHDFDDHAGYLSVSNEEAERLIEEERLREMG